MMERARVFGVLGDPVDHSLSPAMHNAAFAALALPHLYLRYRVTPTALPAALAEARRLAMGGLNLTVPLKEVALPLLDEISPAAGRVRAGNTVCFRRGRLLGDNTDGRGFAAALSTRVRIARSPVLVLGAGGSARAVATALVDAGCPRLVIANRTLERAARLADDLRTEPGRVRAVPLIDVPGELAPDTAVVVNTTSAALAGARIRFDVRRSAPTCLFVDLAYGRRAPFLVAARRARRPTMDGGLMLLHQGALAFTMWTGRRAPLGAMAAALRSAGLALPEPLPRGTSAR
jgi:shikimate dehydrogenase